jgi:hypothetical protein
MRILQGLYESCFIFITFATFVHSVNDASCDEEAVFEIVNKGNIHFYTSFYNYASNLMCLQNYCFYSNYKLTSFLQDSSTSSKPRGAVRIISY